MHNYVANLILQKLTISGGNFISWFTSMWLYMISGLFCLFWSFTFNPNPHIWVTIVKVINLFCLNFPLIELQVGDVNH